MNKNKYNNYVPVGEKFNPQEIKEKTCFSVSSVIPEPVNNGKDDAPALFNAKWGDFVFVYDVVKECTIIPMETVYFSIVGLPLQKDVKLEDQPNYSILFKMNKDLFDKVTSKEIYKERMSLV